MLVILNHLSMMLANFIKIVSMYSFYLNIGLQVIKKKIG